MTNMLMFWILATIIIVIASHPLDEVNDDFRLYRGQSRFAVSMIKSLRNIYPGKNLLFSPHSVYRTLIRAYIGSGGEIKESLKEVLFLNWIRHENDIADAYKAEKIARATRFAGTQIHFKSVDKFYVTKNAMLKPNIKDVFTFSEIERVDFTDLEARRTEINKFVGNISENNINELLPVDSMQNHKNVFLVNSAIFKASLQKPFDERNTKYQYFYGASEQMIEMMYNVGMFNYGILQREKTAVLEMPYKDENDGISIFIFLPLETSSTAVDDLLDKLSFETINDVLQTKMRKTFVDISCPKYSLRSEYFLKDVLKDMGIKNLFDYNLFNNIIHKTVKKCNEGGKMAAAGSSFEMQSVPEHSTSIASGSWSVPPQETVNFHCNRPFAYAINDRFTQEVLLFGVYRGPDSD